MKGKRWMWVGALALWAVALGACGSRAVGDAPCAQLCEDSRQKLIDSFGIPPEEVDCSDPAWQQADTCGKCEALFRDRFDVKPTGVCVYYQ